MMVTIHLTGFFFFQAEDGIRDLTVTGVQTCALPIFLPPDRVDSGLTMLQGEFLKNVANVAVFPGVTDLLTDLQRRGCRMALVTLRDEESTARILEATGLRPYFETVVAGSEAMGNGNGH